MSTLDQELLDILVCPETKQPVRRAGRDLLDPLNRAIDAGVVKSRDGSLVKERIEEGLVREDDGVLYPVRDAIPIMLMDEAIPLGEMLIDRHPREKAQPLLIPLGHHDRVAQGVTPDHVLGLDRGSRG